MKNKLNYFKSRRSLKAVAVDTLIIFDNSRGFDAKYLTHDKLIPPMRWTFCTYHEERREKYQLWIFLLLISTKVNKINPLFQREHMCTKCQILSETSFIAFFKSFGTDVFVNTFFIYQCNLTKFKTLIKSTLLNFYF